MLRHIPGEQPELIGRGFNARGSTSFNSLLETVYEPEVILEQLATLETSMRFAEEQATKVFNSKAKRLISY